MPKLSAKFIKKIYKTLLYILLCGVILPSVIFLIFLLPEVQSIIAKKVVERLSHDLETKVAINRISISPFSGIKVTDFLICDKNDDTLFFVAELRTGIEKFSLKQKKLSFEKIIVQSPTIQLNQKDDKMNYEFLLNNFTFESNDSVKWNYSIEGVWIIDGNLSFNHKYFEGKKFIDDQLNIHNLHLDLNIFTNDSFNTLIINDLSFDETIGLNLKKMKAKIELHSDVLHINQIYFQTNNSTFDFEKIEIPVNISDSLIIEKPFLIEANKISFHALDAIIFLDEFPELKIPLEFSGTLSGSWNNLKGNNIRINFGEISHITTNFDIKDLSNTDATFIYLDVKNMQTSIYDLEFFFTGNSREKTMFPPEFQELGIIKYKGNFTGFIDDMVAYGLFETNLGKVSTDLGVKMREDKSIIFAGLIDTEEFRLGKLVQNENFQLGNISLDVEISGSYKSSDNYFAFLDGHIRSFDLNNYQYNDIELNGLFTHNKFDGNITIIDPNVRLDFIGKVDMSEEIPLFNFRASIQNAQLGRLNLLPKMKESALSLIIESNFAGKNVDDLIGEIKLIDGLFFTPAASVDIDLLTIKAVREGSGKTITLNSNFVDGKLSGHYNFVNFDRKILDYQNNYLPSINKQRNLTAYDTGINDFEFEILFKEINTLASLLFPNFKISNNGKIKGNFNSNENKLHLESSFKHFQYKNISANNIEILVKSDDESSISLTAKALSVEMGQFAEIHNLSIHQKACNDTLITNIIWNNWEDINHSGALYSDITFAKDEDGNRKTNIALNQSFIIIADSIWNVMESKLSFDFESFSVTNLGIEHGNKFVRIDGFQTRKTEDDNLKLRFNYLDLGEFLHSERRPNLSFEGTINGEITLKNYFNEPLLSANLNIVDFVFNGTEYGTFRVNSSWDSEKDALSLTTEISKNEKEQMIGAGHYHLKNRNIDVVFALDSLSVGFLNPLLKNVIQNIKGTGSGNMYLSGPLNSPILTGKLKLNDGSFYVKLLNTSYNLTDSVSFFPGEFRFNNMTISDINNQKGKMYGSIFHKNFKNLNLRLRLDADNMLVMNTSSNENPYYYGTVYGTASMQITGQTGDVNNVNLAINGRTQQNTRFFIPIGSSETVAESGFINFGSKSPKKDENINDKQSMVKTAGVNVDMDLEVTPEAEIQIIFDERFGDILKATGDGNIQLRVDRVGNFRLYGNYTIESGDYHFSLQNYVNRKFIINQGSTITWQGNPSNAIINITAVYRARASLSDLLGSFDNAETTRRRVPINCNLILSENLSSPNIKFDIEAPTLDKSTETLIKDFITSEEEMNRQVFSLLLLNRFNTPNHLRNETVARNSDAMHTGAEMLLSQVNRWVSTLSGDFDVDVAYRMDDDLTSEEFELAISKQFLNNRVTLNSNSGYGKYFSNASKMILDFDIDVKLNKSGTIRGKAYTRTNDYLVYETSPRTQGVGISFREEYSSINELFRKYKKIFKRKEKDEEEEE